MTPRVELLWPRPQRAAATAGPCLLGTAPRVAASGPAAAVDGPRARLEEGLAGLGFGRREDGEATIHLRCEGGASGDAAGEQAYRLEIAPGSVEMRAGSGAGLHGAVATFLQWLRLHAGPGGPPPRRIGGLRIDDRPDFAHRGVMLDVSRNKVPRMATLRELVDALAGLKVNQLQLYTEHTFAYRGHEEVWRGASPMTAAEVRELDAFCRARGVELVPNQNSFGHFHRWLVHPAYRHLAECPQGIEHPFSLEKEPFSLCPLDPGSLELLADLYDQLLPSFTSRLFNTGLDETLDLGRCRSAAACAERGAGRVYLDFLHRVHALVEARGRRMLFWGDVILRSPELVAELPRDAIALEWGYEADHPFADDCRRFAASGLDFYVCPGTSSWSSLGGRTTNALGNLESAARHGREAGALGYLVTDWGDHGHLQPLPVSFPGLLAGAGLAWNAASPSTPSAVAELLDRHLFLDPAGAAGRAFTTLGDAYLDTGATHPNGSALSFLLLFPDQGLDHERLRGLSAAGLERALERIDAARGEISTARMARPDARQVREELEWSAAAMELAARLGLERLRFGPGAPLDAVAAPARRAFARRLEALIDARRELWLARHRPGGLEASLERLRRTRRLLLGDAPGHRDDRPSGD